MGKKAFDNEVQRSVATILTKSWNENKKITDIFTAVGKLQPESNYALKTAELEIDAGGPAHRSIALIDTAQKKDLSSIALSLDTKGQWSVTTSESANAVSASGPNDCHKKLMDWFKAAQTTTGVNWLANINRALQSTKSEPSPKPI